MHISADVEILIERAWACHDDDYVSGLALAEQATETAARLADQRGQCQALAIQGHFLLRLKRDAEAHACLEQGLALSRAVGDRAAEADCLYRLGEERAAAEHYMPSLNYFFAAEKLYDTLEDCCGQAEALSDIGGIYNILGDSGQAVHFHLQAYRLREKFGDKHAVARSLNNIGNVYGRAENFEHSVQYHEQCLAASRENGLHSLEAMCLSNLSSGYSGLGRLPEAVEAGKAALTLAQAQGSLAKQCYALLSIGRAYDKGQQPAEAAGWYSEAVTLARRSNSRRNECEAQNALGDALVSAGRAAEAHPILIRAEETAAALGLTQFRSQALAGLSRTSEHQGDTAAALAYYKEFHALERLLFSEAADKRSKTLLIQMEVEKVQKEAQLHQIKNEELAALNAALAEANQTLHNQTKELQAQAELLEAQGEELRAQADELQRQATEDGLTGLANRRHLENSLARHFSDARRSQRLLSVAMADVDNFKQINDRFGHQVGDEVLMSIGLLLRRACRETDLAARYGGEEFVLVLPQTDPDCAFLLCERVRQAVEGHPWQTIHPSLSVTISIGLSGSETAPSYERLLGLADARLYEAKHAGRNRVLGVLP